MGFHRGDLIALDGEALMGGPVLVRNLAKRHQKLLWGRGLARKIMVEPAETDGR